MSRRRKSRSPKIAIESLEARALLCATFDLIHYGAETFDEFTWPSSESAAAYEVWLNDAETNQLAYREDGLTAPELNLESIDDGDYFAWIQDENADGNGPWRERQRIRIVNGQLIGTAGLLQWQPMAGAETYEVWISKDGLRVDRVSGLTSNSYQLPAMDDGSYDYWIQREDSDGRGDWNTKLSFEVQSGGLVITTSPGTLTWNADDASYSYEIWISAKDSNERVAGSKGLASAAFEVPALEDGAYDVWIRDENSDGSGTWRSKKSFVVDAGQLNATPTVGTLEWEADAGAISYDIWISAWGTTSRIAGEAGLTEAEYRVPDLDAGAYDYWIRANNSDGAGAWSKRESFVVHDGTLSVAGSVGELTWAADPDALSYDIWIKGESSDRNIVSESGIDSPSTEVGYLIDGTYYYWVRTNTAKDSVWSDQRVFRVSNGELLTSSGYLYWGHEADAFSYEISVEEVGDGGREVFQQSGITETQIDIPLLADGQYQFRIQYENRAGKGSWSDFNLFAVEDGRVQRFQNGSFGTVVSGIAFSNGFNCTANANEPVTLHL
ncbi:fibronectin type III domain-containing protein [Fuerstiella marisgermanici]|uniref:Fibronectin type-III domain-containing protein n=1 Tax=Fuerstiella marisgermanici TaxID=1891926 RepID=A0A1P8WFC3_9PLAN|nr:fibronectin type III domain-containing protein [Fuerstiella marisgermanici]APZ92743.1 hypothetical protein Fuma_02355 [Fuerstiella marisgermanici]